MSDETIMIIIVISLLGSSCMIIIREYFCTNDSNVISNQIHAIEEDLDNIEARQDVFERITSERLENFENFENVVAVPVNRENRTVVNAVPVNRESRRTFNDEL